MTLRTLPPYTHIPGVTPHPVRDPAGHLFCDETTPQHGTSDSAKLSALEWTGLPNEAEFRWGVTLFNAGYYWEAHEVWESLWHRAGRIGTLADFLKGIIKLAAAGVKLREHNAGGVRRHSLRARELFQLVIDQEATALPVPWLAILPGLIQWSQRLADAPPPFPEDRTGQAMAILGALPIPDNDHAM